MFWNEDNVLWIDIFLPSQSVQYSDFSTNLGLPMRPRFPFLDVFNHHLAILEESGTLSRLRSKWIYTQDQSIEHLCQQRVDQGEEDDHRVAWQNVTDIFWLLAGGVIGCLIVFGLEKIFWAQIFLFACVEASYDSYLNSKFKKKDYLSAMFFIMPVYLACFIWFIWKSWNKH